MPSGLPEVTQGVAADASRYIAEYRAARAETRGLIEDNRELLRTVAEAQAAMGRGAGSGSAGAGAGAAEIAKVNAAIREQLQVLGDHSGVIGDVTAAGKQFSDVQGEIAAMVRETGGAARDTTGALGDLAGAQRELVSVQKESTGALEGFRQAIRVYRDDATRGFSDVAESAKLLNDTVAATAYGSRDVLRSAGASAGDAFASGMSDSLRRTNPADALKAVMAQANAVANEAYASAVAPPRYTGTPTLADLAAVTAATQAARRGPTSDAAVAAALAALGGGGGGGGGGGLGGGIAGFAAAGGGGTPGTAGYDAAVVIGAVKRAATVGHWIIMGVNEALATIGPAAVALGAASLVGLQGGQQMVNRYNAIDTTAESLGPAFGQTTGSFLGVGSKLQQYQDLAGGGVYELAGAGLNILKANQGGSSFGQMGLNTIAMLDRGVADMQMNMQQRGTGAELSQILGGGTGYLQQFGDIGANIGNTFLGLAPHLPGVGGDYISALEGLTGGLAGGIGGLNKAGLGGILGGLLAGEAGWRVGKPVVGLAGKGLGALGDLIGKIPVKGLGVPAGGLTGTDLADIAGMTGVELGPESLEAGGVSLAGVLGGAGAGLEALGGPEVAALAVSAFLGSKLYSSMPTRSQRQVAGLQAGINQAGFTGAWQPLGKAITTATGLAAAQPATWQSNIPTGETSEEIGRFGPTVGGPTTAQVYQNAALSFSQQMGDLISSGPQLQAALAKAGLKGASLGDAFQIAQNSLLDMSHAFGAGGKLTPQAKQMMANYVSAIGPMTQNAGAFGAAVAGQTIMGSAAMSDVSKVNQAMDSMTQIASAGPAGMATLFGMLGGAPVTATSASTRAGIRLKAPPSYAQFAQALTSFSSASGSAAWNTFAGSQGLIAAQQANADQERTALTLGATTPGAVAGLTGFQIQQMLPMAQKSPAALALLMQQMMQGGVAAGTGGAAPGYYNPALSQKQNYQDAVAATSKIADNSKQANAATNAQTVALSRLPVMAQQFAQSMAPTLQTQTVADAATQAINLRNAALGGGTDKTAAQQLVADIKSSGVSSAAGIKDSLNAVLGQVGISKTMQIKIDSEVLPPKLPAIPKPPPVEYPSHVKPPVNPPPTPGARVTYPSMVTKPIAPPAPAGGTVVYHSVVIGPGSSGSVGPGVVGTAPGSGGGIRIMGQTGFKVPGYGGGDIFGPAMLEPGELVVPKHMVAAGAVDHLRGSIPGFAAGGIAYGDVPNITGVGVAFRIAMQETVDGLVNALNGMFGQVTSSIRTAGSSFGMGGPGGLQPSGGPVPRGTAADPVAVHVASVSPAAGALPAGVGGAPVPAAASKIFDAFEKTFAGMPSPWKGLASQILNGLIDGIKNAPKETASMAQALVNKVKTEIAYGQGVTATAVQGLNFPGMQVATPTMTAQGQPYQYYTDQQNIAAGGQPGSVQEQMGSYLQAMKSFQGDMGKLAKGGLEKRLMSQLYSAGPIQGDAEAQSILGGAGGIKAANNLYNQINSVATKLGVSAIGNVYGMPGGQAGHPALSGKPVKVPVHADTAAAQAAINAIHGKTVTVNVNLSISGGGGGGSGGGVDLSPAQVKQVTAKVQAALLQQAKRNRKTGIQLPGYGS